MFHENFFDLGSFVDDIYDRPDTKTVNINHFFQVKKESPHIGYHQEFHDEAGSENNFKKDNAYSGTQRNIRIINIL